jgi:hypothetical protein
MDKKFCDYCGQEIWDNEWFELTKNGKTFYSREKVTTCTYKCMEEWINRERRRVNEDANKKKNKVGINSGEYYNNEIGSVDIDECNQEYRAFDDPCLVVKPEIFRARADKRL